MAATYSTTTANTTTTLFNSPTLDSVGLVVGLVIFYVMVSTCAIVSNITILIAIGRRLVPRNTVNVFFSRYFFEFWFKILGIYKIIRKILKNPLLIMCILYLVISRVLINPDPQNVPSIPLCKQ